MKVELTKQQLATLVQYLDRVELRGIQEAHGMMDIVSTINKAAAEEQQITIPEFEPGSRTCSKLKEGEVG